MKKFWIIGICVLLVAVMLAGCSCERGDIDPTEVTEATEEEFTQEATGEEILLPIEDGLDMLYATGASAWGTVICLNADGSFTGNYHDSEMGMGGDGYEMTVFESVFSGKFKDIEKIEDYAYSMKLDCVETKTPAWDEKIEDWDGVLVKTVAAEAFGIEGGEDFILYLPHTPVDELDEEFLWWNFEKENEDGLLGRYGLYNINECAGFFTYE